MIPSIDLRNRKVLKNYHVWSTSVSLYMPVTYIAAPHLHPTATNKSSSTSARYNYHLKPITPNFDSSIALTILVLITAIFFMGFFSVYLRCFAKVSSTAEQVSSLRRNRNQQQRQRQTSSTSGEESTTSHQHHGLDPSTVGSLPLVSAGGKAKQQPVECVVCLSEFEDTEIVKMIPYCEHVFHPQCIDMWFLSHSTCPLCRSTKLFPSPPYRNSNSILPAVNDKCGGDVANSLSLSGRELGHDDDDQVGVCHESLDKKPRVLVEGDKSDDVGDTDQEEVVDQRDEVLKCRRPMKLNMRRTRSCSSLSSSSAHQVLLQRSLSSN